MPEVLIELPTPPVALELFPMLMPFELPAPLGWMELRIAVSVVGVGTASTVLAVQGVAPALKLLTCYPYR